MSKVKVYTKYGCPQCEMTKTVLSSEGVEFDVVNVEDDEEAINYVKNELGFSAMPVVVKEGETPFSGFQPDKLKGMK